MKWLKWIWGLWPGVWIFLIVVAPLLIWFSVTMLSAADKVVLIPIILLVSIGDMMVICIYGALAANYYNMANWFNQTKRNIKDFFASWWDRKPE